MKGMRFNRRPSLGIALLAAAATAAILMASAGAETGPAVNGLIYGCMKTDGSFKMVTETKLCSSLGAGWTRVNWNGTGVKGDKGDPGTPGTNGLDGAKGDKGDPGEPGAAGTDGTNGTNGVDGAKGDKGDPGEPGAAGTDGTNGTNGVDGAKGDKGDPGEPGADGTDGTNGTNGVDGAKGDKGDKGDPGEPGAAGTNGTNGVDGAKGDKGDPGEPGAKGDKGDTGASGANQVLFSSGGNLANSKFVGLGLTGNEADVAQIVAAAGTATKMSCYVQTAPTVSLTFTLRVNGASVGLTCTIAAGQKSGSGTGSASWSAGALLAVATPAAGTPGHPGSFAISNG